ncbi:MAG: alkaline phosphatase family protein [Xanthomonadales bacterium]|nr:alkaline phosphatase family protein [Xanthomonadales bacterium]
MPRNRSLRLLASLLLCVALLPGCSDQREPVSKRVIILGFDGMDPNLASNWMDQGLLPNFDRLRKEGFFGPLATSNPPQSPVAWVSFATGTTPGTHGIYDFLRRDPETYAPDFSISRVTPAKVWEILGIGIPISSGEIINRRIGQPFWSAYEEHGGQSTVLRVPVTFPPDPIHRMMAGMGVPDLLGTQGTYTLYSTRPLSRSATNARVERLRPDREQVMRTTLEGPAHPLKMEAPPLSVPLVIQPDGEAVSIQLDEVETRLQPGTWSDWVTVEFPFAPLQSVAGTVRLYLISGYPEVELYVSPIQIHPQEPVVPLSSPADYAPELAERIGLYHTIGMPEETWSLNENHLSDEAWLAMEKTILAEREAMFFDALEQRDSALVVGVFVQTDRVSHMFYRGLDEQHPLYPETSPLARGAIQWIYTEADRILGQTLDSMGPEDQLIIVSDHGFAPFRRAVHLNRWLVDEGYLVLRRGQSESDAGFLSVDWSRSRAYALGLNGLYLNRAGRESQGILTDAEARLLKSELAAKLMFLTDPASGADMVRRVFDGDEIYAGNANGDAPDLVVGYDSGYRASWQTTLGAVPATLVEDNRRKWSGDHCMDPEVVPGVLFTSFPTESPPAAIRDIAPFVQSLLAGE